jgi:hypothetical protein
VSKTPLPDQSLTERFQVQALIPEQLLGSFTTALDGALRQAQTLAQRHKLAVAVWRHVKESKTGKTVRIELVKTVEAQPKARA